MPQNISSVWLSSPNAKDKTVTLFTAEAKVEMPYLAGENVNMIAGSLENPRSIRSTGAFISTRKK